MISSDIVQQMADLIVERFHPDKIILFGSRAQGMARPDSDVDLLIVAQMEVPPWQRAPAVMRALGEFHLPCDVIVKAPDEYLKWRGAVNHIVYFADKCGTVLYERASSSES